MRKTMLGCAAVALLAAGASAQDSARMACDPARAQDPELTEAEGSWTAGDRDQLDPETLNGALLRTCEGEPIATVEDVILTPEGEFDGVAVRLEAEGAAGSDIVLLGFEEVEIGKNGDEPMLRTSYTLQELQRRPEYVAPDG